MASGPANRLTPDSTQQSVADSLQIDPDSLFTTQEKKRTTIDAQVIRTATDSILQDIRQRKVFMYGNATIKYQDIEIKAAYIEVDFKTNSIFARGVTDSTGKLNGTPEFTQAGQTIKAETMSYNFDTKKGIISTVITEDGQGFLHGQRVKKFDDNTINILHGQYTTCNLEAHPHYSFMFKKAKVIPDDKIITGPAYMQIEGMPTPLGLPFGYFPNKGGQTSGIVIPTYGESTLRGFYLENGGYYFAINDYMDFEILGDIYSRGSWGVKPSLRYKKRYKYNGAFNFGYAQNVTGTKDAPDFNKTTDFRIRWNHSQDPKARPNSTFSANVNIVSSNYVKYNVVSSEDYLSNEFQSSVAYQTNWNGNYHLTVNASHRQNTKTHIVQINLPELTFSVNRFYPLRRESGKKRFYEDLSISYSMNTKNTINTLDSVLFSPGSFDTTMQNGMVHRIPISIPAKVLKYFTLNLSANITDRMYTMNIDKQWVDDTLFTAKDTIVGYVRTDTSQGFKNTIDYSFSANLSTKLYGMLKFKKGPVRAIRHVLTPQFGFTYTPDFGTDDWGYYGSYVDGDGEEHTYSKYEGSLFGGPSGQKSGRITYSFANTLEMKVPSKKDTITGLRKIKLIEGFNIGGNYDIARDSVNLSVISMSGRTNLYKNLNIQYGSSWDPYVLDSAGRRTNQFEWDANKRFLRLEKTSWNVSFSLNLSDKDFNKKKAKTEQTDAPQDQMDSEVQQEEMREIMNSPDSFVDWNIPWSLNLRYTFAYINNIRWANFVETPNKTITQTLGFGGQINITPKWKFTVNSGWDFTQKKLSYTSINIYRDLHCWEMRFSWIPLGARQSWNFSINVKASILQDLKLNRKKDFRDI